jgi:hypothetical protein
METMNGANYLAFPSAELYSAVGDINQPALDSLLPKVYVVDGLTYASVASAISDCLAGPATSCTIDARGGAGGHSIGSFDPRSKSVTLMLGSFTDYTSSGSITLRNNLQIIGQGNISTAITSTSSSNEPMFVLPQANDSPAIAVRLQGFRLYPAPDALSQIGADLECNSWTNSGLWFGILEDVWFGDDVSTQFPGGGLKMSCPSTSSAIQFTQFRNVNSYRKSGSTHPALYICGGGFGNDQFYGGNFNAGNSTDATVAPNIYLGACPVSTGDPYSLIFDGITGQGGALIMQFNGVNQTTIRGMHMEGIPGLTSGYKFTLTAGTSNTGITIDGADFQNIGQGSGKYVVSTTSGGAYLSIALKDTVCGFSSGSATNWIVGGVSTQSVLADETNTCVGPSTITPLLQGDTATLETGNNTYVNVLDRTIVVTINSTLSANNSLCFTAVSVPIVFGTGGNINLLGSSSLTLQNGETTCFIYNDRYRQWLHNGKQAVYLSGTITITPDSVAFRCATGTSSVPGATTSMVVLVSAAGTADLHTAAPQAWVSSSGEVTASVCTVNAESSPRAITYNLRVLP